MKKQSALRSGSWGGWCLFISSIFLPSFAAAQQVTCLGQPATIVGTAGDDVLNGTSGDDVIAGLAGNDVIRGEGGNDRICGGTGNDTLEGGAGRDRLSGGGGTDTLDGNEGNDTLDGQAGDDILKGGAGRDTLSGGSGSDILVGQDADDTLRGGAGEDTLNGGGGTDILDGQADNDTCFNGEQNSGCETTCTETTAEEFETQAFGAWADTLNHARSLGYANTEVAQSCIEVSTGETKHVAATLVNPTGSPPDDRVFLASSTPYHLAFLVKVDANGIPTVFNQNGGVRMPPDAPGEVVGADGTPLGNASTSQVMSAVANDCPAAWVDYLFCLAEENALTIVQTAACFIAIDLELIATGATLGTAAAFLTPATLAICSDIIAGPIPPGAEGSSCNPPNDDVCELNSQCSEVDTCQWGFCVPAIPANTGADCSDESSAFPRCATGSQSVLYTLECKDSGYCALKDTDCPTGQMCTGDPGSASCQNECDDAIACTRDEFVPGIGCTHTPDDSLCATDNDNSDANCTKSICSPQDSRSDASGCLEGAIEPDGSLCDDGVACTTQDICANSGICAGGMPDDSFCPNQDNGDGDCLRIICSGGGCLSIASEPDFSPCDDGDLCTSGDFCFNLGVCVGNRIPNCP